MIYTARDFRKNQKQALDAAKNGDIVTIQRKGSIFELKLAGEDSSIAQKITDVVAPVVRKSRTSQKNISAPPKTEATVNPKEPTSAPPPPNKKLGKETKPSKDFPFYLRDLSNPIYGHPDYRKPIKKPVFSCCMTGYPCRHCHKKESGHLNFMTEEFLPDAGV